jgi:DNA-binding beta-propeller fold protein YncE
MKIRGLILLVLLVAFNHAAKGQTVTDPWATLGASNIQTALIAIDASNNLYVTNYGNNTISKITPNGIVTQAWATLAGNSRPYGIVIDASGNLYTANRIPTNTISKITPSSDGSSGSVIQTWANLGAEAYTIAIDASGNLYAPFVSTNQIAKIVPAADGATGTVTKPWVTLATGANPFSISFDASGNLYSANSNNTISKITPAGSVTQAWATLAASSNPQFMVFDPTGNLYVSCWGTSTVCKINSSGTVTNVWSVGTSVWPAGIVLDATGNVYTANNNNNTVSKITSSGTVTQAYATLATGSSPFHLAKDASGNLYTTNMGNGKVSRILGPNIYANSFGQRVSIENANTAISPEGGANFGTGRDIYGKRYNTTGISTTSGTVASTTAVLGGIISATNAISASIGVLYSTDINFGTSTSTTIQSNVGAGTYTSSISGLSAATTYYAKAFVTNSAGTSYGSVVNFTTTSPPTLASLKFSNSNISHLPNYYIATSNLTLSQLPTSWTIQWIYRLDESTATADGMHWFFRNPSTTGKYSTDMHVYQIGEYLQFWYNGNSYTFNATYQDYIMTGNTQNSTYKIAVTYDGTNFKTYSNGVLISTIAINITVKPTNSTLRMGSNFGRTIDEFRIWDSALSAAQITANQGSSATGSSGLMLYYNFNEGAAGANNTAITTVVDQSGNNRNGVFYNMPLTGSVNNFVTSIVTGF